MKGIKGAEGCIALRNFGPFSRALISLVSQAFYDVPRAIHLLMWKMRQRANRLEGNEWDMPFGESWAKKSSLFFWRALFNRGSSPITMICYPFEHFFIDVSEKNLTIVFCGTINNWYLHITLEIK